MDKLEQLALQTTKEIVVKFVETGRISPSNFADHFQPIYQEILRTISGGEPDGSRPAAEAAAPGKAPAAKATPDKAAVVKPGADKKSPAKADQDA